FADDEYMDTYFGVSNAEAARSRFTAFDAGAGIKSAGVIADTRYQWNDNWAVTAEASWHRLVGDAADSPVVDLAGEENQFTAGIGVAYRFRFDLFN
ncbi:MAG: MipA/OmpV family protein, partial [Pseudomonadota bacterium]